MPRNRILHLYNDCALLCFGHRWKHGQADCFGVISLCVRAETRLEPKVTIVWLEIDREVMQVHADTGTSQCFENGAMPAGTLIFVYADDVKMPC